MIRGVIYIRGAAKQMTRAMAPALRDALKAALLLWHQKDLPRHFEPGAAGRYHYQARNQKYQKRKLRAKGHQIDLVYSGELAAQVTRRVDITGTNREAKAALHGPRYLYAYRKDFKQPDKAKEILKTTHAEDAELGQAVDKQLTETMNGLKETETVRI